MGELRQEFLKQTISNLNTLQKETLGKPTLSDDFLRRFFRQLHTIKGTSNTFNLNHLAYLAHEIENLLQAVQNHQIEQSTETKNLFRESFRQLLNLATDYQLNLQISFPQDFTEKIRSLIPNQENHSLTDFLVAKIPTSILSQLAAQEKNNLKIAIQSGKNLYSLQVFFNMATFYEDFKYFKETLSLNGEVIAVSPIQTENNSEEIGFQTFFVSNLPKNEVEKLIESFTAKIEFEIDFAVKNYADNLEGVTSCLADIGRKTAQLLDKSISFERTYDDFEVSANNLILLKGIASHLLHNAIDHAIETPEERLSTGKNQIATIKITVEKVENSLLLEIEDDGRGIDVEKITQRAKTKGLIEANKILDENEALKLIFLQGFSTSETVSEISGRGVGLDAVKDLVEQANGKLEIQTKLGKGTIFSVYLPNV